MMEELKNRVKKELETIGDKGLTSSNLDTTYKLIDIYKDIVEVCEKEGHSSYDMKGGRYNDYDIDRKEHFNDYYPMDERTGRYYRKMKDGMSDYMEGKRRYRGGDSDQRMVEGIEMTMSAILNFIESLMDIAETPKEKEIVRHYVDKIKKV